MHFYFFLAVLRQIAHGLFNNESTFSVRSANDSFRVQYSVTILGELRPAGVRPCGETFPELNIKSEISELKCFHYWGLLTEPELMERNRGIKLVVILDPV